MKIQNSGIFQSLGLVSATLLKGPADLVLTTHLNGDFTGVLKVRWNTGFWLVNGSEFLGLFGEKLPGESSFRLEAMRLSLSNGNIRSDSWRSRRSRAHFPTTGWSRRRKRSDHYDIQRFGSSPVYRQVSTNQNPELKNSDFDLSELRVQKFEFWPIRAQNSQIQILTNQSPDLKNSDSDQSEPRFKKIRFWPIRAQKSEIQILTNQNPESQNSDSDQSKPVKNKFRNRPPGPCSWFGFGCGN